MSDFTDYIEEQIIDWTFGGSDMPAAHANVYVSLHTADPTNSGEANEVDSGTTNYSRAETTANGDWTRTGNQAENAAEIGFGVADGSWGTITHFSIWDAESAGNALMSGELDQSKTVEENDEIRFDAGNLTAEVN